MKTGNHLSPIQRCSFCFGKVEYVNNEKIYGSSYGHHPFAYLCGDCGAYVGVHAGTKIPLGTLADASLRTARKLAKEPFLKLCKNMDRTLAYFKLSHLLCIAMKECHFGWFNVEMCGKAYTASCELLAEEKSK